MEALANYIPPRLCFFVRFVSVFLRQLHLLRTFLIITFQVSVPKVALETTPLNENVELFTFRRVLLSQN